MGNRRYRPQTQKDTANARVRRVQELRRSNASEPIPSRSKYDRNDYRRAAQAGRWEV